MPSNGGLLLWGVQKTLARPHRQVKPTTAVPSKRAWQEIPLAWARLAHGQTATTGREQSKMLSAHLALAALATQPARPRETDHATLTAADA